MLTNAEPAHLVGPQQVGPVQHDDVAFLDFPVCLARVAEEQHRGDISCQVGDLPAKVRLARMPAHASALDG